MTQPTQPTIGVVVVTYDSEEVIEECIGSLLATVGCHMQIAVVENASTDNTAKKIRDVSRDQPNFNEINVDEAISGAPKGASGITLIRSEVNRGYAGGVNVGLQYCRNLNDIDYFWVINPDCRVLTDTGLKFVERAAQVPTFGLMGGRVLYVKPEHTIQSDGGVVNPWTGMCANLNLSKDSRTTPYPEASRCDYISGANIFVSRPFLNEVGLMQEDYFLYYEEVDWALRRGRYELAIAEDAVIYHHAGTSIGSPVVGRVQGSAFSNYFNYRNRMRLMRQFFPARLPIAYCYSLLKVARLLLQGHRSEADGAFRGLNGMVPPSAVRSRLSPEAYELAFKARRDAA